MLRPALRPPRLLLAPLLLLAGCGAPAAEATSVPDGFEDGVPAPTGAVVLTLDVDGSDVAWDIATLDMLEQHELTIHEPFINEQRTFTGPLFADVLVASGVDLAESTEVELVALDEFVAVIPTTEDALDGLLLATTDDGAAIPVEAGGPTRLIFPDGNPTGENLNTWIWSIVSGAVR